MYEPEFASEASVTSTPSVLETSLTLRRALPGRVPPATWRGPLAISRLVLFGAY